MFPYISPCDFEECPVIIQLVKAASGAGDLLWHPGTYCFSGAGLLTSTTLCAFTLGIYAEKLNLPDTLKIALNHPENLCSEAWVPEAAREEESLFFF